MELADMRDLGSRAARRAGSSPVTRTKEGAPTGAPSLARVTSCEEPAHAKRDGSDGRRRMRAQSTQRPRYYNLAIPGALDYNDYKSIETLSGVQYA